MAAAGAAAAAPTAVPFRPWPLFTRRPVVSRWSAHDWAGPYQWLTLREWRVQSMLSPLPKPLYDLLHPCLLVTARAGWLGDALPLEHFPMLHAEILLWDKTLSEFRQALIEELRACWQTLDEPLYLLSGLTCNHLLAKRGRRLCQLAEACEHVAGASSAYEEFLRALHAVVK